MDVFIGGFFFAFMPLILFFGLLVYLVALTTRLVKAVERIAEKIGPEHPS